MKKLGFDVVLYYLSTDDVEINIERVKGRVKEGGHNIPEAIIRSRYEQSHSYLKTKLPEFKTAYLIDNSSATYNVEVQLEFGRIISRSNEVSRWVTNVLSFIMRIQHKLQRI